MSILSWLANKFGPRSSLGSTGFTVERTVNRRTRRALKSIARRKKPRGFPHIQPGGYVSPGKRG